MRTLISLKEQRATKTDALRAIVAKATAENRDLNDAEQGAFDNAGKLLIMDGDMKFEKMAFSPEDAEFLDSRKLGNEDVARIFGLPPTSVGITDKAGRWCRTPSAPWRRGSMRPWAGACSRMPAGARSTSSTTWTGCCAAT